MIRLTPTVTTVEPSRRESAASCATLAVVPHPNMPFPKQREIDLPLLGVVEHLGGTAKPQDVYPLVAAQFPELSPEELTQTLESSTSTRKWWNLVQWVRQHLVECRELDGQHARRFSTRPGSRARSSL